jgi:hypothetical protein
VEESGAERSRAEENGGERRRAEESGGERRRVEESGGEWRRVEQQLASSTCMCWGGVLTELRDALAHFVPL